MSLRCLRALPLIALLSACQADGDRFLTGYAGRYTDAALGENIALWNDVQFENAGLVAVAVSQVIHQRTEAYRVELEGNVARWFGDQDHTELNAHILLRHLTFPWDHWLDTSVGFGNGLSLASSLPDLEDRLQTDTGSSRLLYYIAVEVEAAIPGLDGWWALLRVHHRSGVFGTFSEVNGGSNVIALGLRVAL